MKPEQQRIKIAKVCGWTEISERCMWGLPPNAIDDGTENCLRHFPKYESDLNAMHEAEKSLDDDLDLDYSENLESVTGTRWGANNSYDMSKYRSATAAQRAEAFLKTLNLWTE